MLSGSRKKGEISRLDIPPLYLCEIHRQLFFGKFGKLWLTLGYLTREERSILLIEINQFFPNLPSLIVVCGEERRTRKPREDKVDLCQHQILV